MDKDGFRLLSTSSKRVFFVTQRYYQNTRPSFSSFPLAPTFSRKRGPVLVDKRMHVSTFIAIISLMLMVLFISMPTIAADATDNIQVTCPNLCECFPPTLFSVSTQSKSTLSINCSNKSLDDLTYVLGSILMDTNDSDKNENDTATEKLIKNHIQVFDLSKNRLENVRFTRDSIIGRGNSSSHWLVINTLNLGHNLITNISADNEDCVLDRVTNLDLSFNLIESLNNVAIWNTCPGLLGSLHELNLSHNSIAFSYNTSLSQLLHLTSLDLSFNQLQSIHSASFGGLVALQTISLSNNKIMNIDNLFPNIPNLISLDLSNNKLDDLPSSIFSGLTFLQWLNLANNNIARLGTNAFIGLAGLHKLSISANPITSITEPVFRNLSLLNILDMYSMPELNDLSHNVFLSLGSLTHLNMSHNPKLQFLQPDIFSPTRSLQVLDISNSGLQRLSFTTFLSQELRTVFLKGLPLSCECTNAWLANEQADADTKFVYIQSSQCIDKDNQWHLLSTVDFQCQPVLINSTEGTVTIGLGSKLMLQCQQVSSEMAVLSWTAPNGLKFYHHDFHPDSLSHLLSPDDVSPGSSFHRDHYWHTDSAYHTEIAALSNRILVLTDGSLYIDYMLRSDTGEYKCEVDNGHYNHSIGITLHLQYEIGGRIKIIAFIIGFLSAIGFFTLNAVYVISSWTARRLVNKRRREIILQMLENLNTYKSVQVSRIHENYLHQLNRVRNQYHVQRDRLHRNYTGQVVKVKRGCSNQVERVRDNYHSKLTQLREYSSRQILQIREGANNQIGRIRDYGSLQLERLRETYKLQQQHVLKLLDTMNLDNCRSVVETECMRTESMMFDIDLLEPDERIDSPTSPESDYNTANSSPTATSDRFTLEIEDYKHSDIDDEEEQGIHIRNGQTGAGCGVTQQKDDSQIEMELHNRLMLPGGISVESREVWTYAGDENDQSGHILYTKVNNYNQNGSSGMILPSMQQQMQQPTNCSNFSSTANGRDDRPCELTLLGQCTLDLDQAWTEQYDSREDLERDRDSKDNWSQDYATPEASPVKLWDGGENWEEMGAKSKGGVTGSSIHGESEL